MHLSKNFKKIIIIQMFFIALSFFIMYPLLLNKHLLFIDGLYHIQEAKEIAFDIQNGIWPSFNHLYGISGSATPTFYPWLSLIPFIIGSIAHITMHTIFVLYICGISYSTLNIIFFTALKYFKSIKCAFLSSILVTITIIQFQNYILDDFALALATPFIFLEIIGWIKWLKDGKWLELTVTMSVLVYLNYIAAYETLFILIILTILSISKLNKSKIFNGIKATICTLGVTATIWVPLIIISSSNKLYIPISKTLFFNSNNAKTQMIFTFPYIQILITIIMILFWNHLSYLQHRIIITILFLLIIIFVIPTNALANTPLIIMQFMFRFMTILNILTVFLIMPFLRQLARNINYKYVYRLIVTGLFVQICAILMILAIIGRTPLHLSEPNGYKNTIIRNIKYFYVSHNTVDRINQNKTYRNHFYNEDYLPESLQHHLLIQINAEIPSKEPIASNQKVTYVLKKDLKKWHMRYITNGISIRNNSNRTKYNAHVPILIYHGQKYQFYLNHHKIHHIIYNHHELLLKKLSKGTNIITYKIPVMPYRYISAIISLFSILYTLILYKKIRS